MIIPVHVQYLDPLLYSKVPDATFVCQSKESISPDYFLHVSSSLNDGRQGTVIKLDLVQYTASDLWAGICSQQREEDADNRTVWFR